MPSGKRAKAQRRQVPPPPVRGASGPGARKASPRTLAIAGGAILLVILAVVLAIVLTKNGESSTVDPKGDTPTIGLAPGTPATGSSTGPNAFFDAAEVETMLAGIEQHGLVLGDPDAPVTLVEYIDLQCPVCKDFEISVLPTLITKYVRPGKLKIEIKPWNILDNANGSVDSLRGQKVTIAAGEQNKAFQYAAILYNNQGFEGTNWMDNTMTSNIAASIDGLDTKRFVSDANSSATNDTLKAIDAYANSQPSFTGTPTILLGKGTEKPVWFYTGLPDLGSLEAAIRARLP